MWVKYGSLQGIPASQRAVDNVTETSYGLQFSQRDVDHVPNHLQGPTDLKRAMDNDHSNVQGTQRTQKTVDSDLVSLQRAQLAVDHEHFNSLEPMRLTRRMRHKKVIDMLAQNNDPG